jgi:hypothetical protein
MERLEFLLNHRRVEDSKKLGTLSAAFPKKSAKTMRYRKGLAIKAWPLFYSIMSG